jgi:hypothetical protein
MLNEHKTAIIIHVKGKKNCICVRRGGMTLLILIAGARGWLVAGGKLQKYYSSVSLLHSKINIISEEQCCSFPLLSAISKD